MLALAIGIVGFSVLFSFVAEPVINAMGMGESGAVILLGLVTSLPEVVAAVQLFRMKNNNAAFSELIGSSCANTLCLVINDIVYKGNMYDADGENPIIGNMSGNTLVVILTFICLFAFVGAIVLVKTLKKHHEKM
jgi:Ca2+/Na+ antiporter